MSTPRDAESLSAPVDDYSRLLSFAAHELRTPASVVGGYLRMLQKDDEQPLSERHRALVDHATRSCQRLVELIAELSEVGKLDNNTAAVHAESFDLFADLTDVAGAVVEGRDRGVSFDVTGLSSGAKLTGDRQRFRTAFGALFRALLREQGMPVVMHAVRRIVRARGTATAVVVIAHAADVDRALERPAGPFDERRGGMGLSLLIARRVIERAGGRISAPLPESAEDRSLRSAAIVSIPLND